MSDEPVKRTPDFRPLTDEDFDVMGGTQEDLPQLGLDDRIEGLEAIRDILNPHMAMSTFYARHRQELDYILFVDKDYWREMPRRPRFFTFRRLIYHYMLKRRII